MSSTDETQAAPDPAETGSGRRKGRAPQRESEAAGATGPGPAQLVAEAERELANYQIAHPESGHALNTVRGLLQQAAHRLAADSAGDGGYATGGTGG